MTTDSERMARAGDYVLGRMDDETRQRAERDLEVDPAFRNCVLRLLQRYEETGIPAQRRAAPAAHWNAVQADLAALPQMKAVLAVTPVATAITAKPEKPRQAWAGAMAHALGGWRGLSIALCLIVAAGVGYVARAELDRQPALRSVAVLRTPDNNAAAIVETYADSSLRVVALGALDVEPGRHLSLWRTAIAETTLVGTVAGTGETRFDAQPSLMAAGEFRLSAEAADGIATPSGAILAEGSAQPLAR